MSTGNKYFTIGEVTSKTGVKQTVLRFWESEFEILEPIKNKFGHRAYTDKDIAIVLMIKNLLYDKGMTIKGAKKSLINKEEIPLPINSNELKNKLMEILDILNDNK